MATGTGLAPLDEPVGQPSLTGWAPYCDVFETKNEIIVKAELPGLKPCLKKEEVKVSLENGVLTIHGERKLEQTTGNRDHYRLGRQYGEFSRGFTVPGTVDAARIGAEFTDGVLRVTLPKYEEAKPKAVEVSVK